MLRSVIALLVAGFAAAVVGALVNGLFWLTVVAFPLMLLSGAVALSLLRPLEMDARSGRTGKADLVRLDVYRNRGRRRASADVGGLRRTA